MAHAAAQRPPPRTPIEVRPVVADDLPAVACLYRHYVDHSLATWAAPGEHASPEALAARWRAATARGLPWLALVATAELDAADGGCATALPADLHDEPPGPGSAGYAAQPALPARSALGPTRLLGYAYAVDFRPRHGWAITAESSIYLAPGWGGCGLGDRLLAALLAACSENATLRSVVAAISVDPADASVGAASVALHRKHGFEPAGRLVGAGVKAGRLMDALLLQRQLRAVAAA